LAGAPHAPEVSCGPSGTEASCRGRSRLRPRREDFVGAGLRPARLHSRSVCLIPHRWHFATARIIRRPSAVSAAHVHPHRADCPQFPPACLARPGLASNHPKRTSALGRHPEERSDEGSLLVFSLDHLSSRQRATSSPDNLFRRREEEPLLYGKRYPNGMNRSRNGVSHRARRTTVLRGDFTGYSKGRKQETFGQINVNHPQTKPRIPAAMSFLGSRVYTKNPNLLPHYFSYTYPSA